MKTYSVTYSTTTSYEAIVLAKNAEEAKKKVIEVIGNPVTIEEAYELGQ
jgi:hypothetical protein